MEVTWTNTFTMDFDLDQAEEDFWHMLEWDPNTDPETAIQEAIESNWYFGHEDIIDASPAFEQCAKALRKRIGGIQMQMELPPFSTL